MDGKADLILHPVRWRIIQAFIGRSQLSARQVSDLLPDIPQATLYRQFQKLARAGLIAVVAERPVRGTVEKTYAIQEQNIELTTEELNSLSHEDHQRYFRQFVVSLMADFDQYLQREEIDLARDGVGYRQVAVNLTPAELSQMLLALNEALHPFLQKKLTNKRQRYLLSRILMPGE